MIKQVKNLDDLNGVVRDTPVIVKMASQVPDGQMKIFSFDNVGIFYQRRGNLFSVIGPIATNMGPPIGEIDYWWNEQAKTFVLKDSRFLLKEGSKTYKRYERLLNENFGEITQPMETR